MVNYDGECCNYQDFGRLSFRPNPKC